MNAYIDDRYVAFRATFSIVDVEAREDATPSYTVYNDITQLKQLTDDIKEMSFKAGVAEPDYYLLDGTYTLLPEDLTPYQTGWWSNTMSDEEGNIGQYLTFNFSETHDSVGFMVYFDTVANEYCTDFTISTYNASGGLINKVNVMDNTSSVVSQEVQSEGYKKVEFHFTKTSKPYRRVRISEIIFGVDNVYHDDNLTSAKLVRELSATSAELPYSTLELTIDNLDKRYNMINPTSIYRFLQQYQPLVCEIGIGESRDTIEYKNMGTYYFSKSEATDDSMTATINFTDKIAILDRTVYRKGANDKVTVEELVNEIIEESGIEVEVNIDSNVKNRQIFKALPIATCREALRLAVEAARCTCYIDTEGVMQITGLSGRTDVDTLDNDNMSAVPSISVPEKVNAVEVTAHTFTASRNEGEIYNSAIAINGTKTIWIDYGKACYRVNAEITGGTILEEEYYMYCAKLRIQAAGDATLTLTGTEYSDNATVYRAENIAQGDTESVLTVDNPLVLYDDADALAQWKLNIAGKYQYNIKSRGNPERDISDSVKVYDAYGENRSAIITSDIITYDGALSEEIEGIEK